MLDFSRFEWLSFDCYGTLIDWESGILGYLRPLLRRKGTQATSEQILSLYSDVEPEQQSGRYRSYRQVLSSVVEDFSRHYGFDVTALEAEGLADSIRDWQPFRDTVPSLRRLQSRFKLAVLSNIDDDLFAYTAPKLGVRLDNVITAQQVGSYKPATHNFKTLLQRLEVEPGRLLHVAESLFHDVAPASSLGVSTVWVNRRQGKDVAASKLADVKPSLEVKTLAELAELAVPPEPSA